MKIVRLEKHSEKELLERLRKVSMFTDENKFVYKKASISLEKIHPRYLAPPQSYVLAKELQKVRELRFALLEKGVDLFNLEGYVTIYREEIPDTPIDVMPAVIEESIERDGSIQQIICDGMHRTYLARIEWVIPKVIFIRGLKKELPYYAFPWQGGWDKVVMREDLPEGFVKKWHRIENYKSLYRNFNSAFNNVGGPRGRF